MHWRALSLTSTQFAAAGDFIARATTGGEMLGDVVDEMREKQLHRHTIKFVKRQVKLVCRCFSLRLCV
jgi:hypothetical protein